MDEREGLGGVTDWTTLHELPHGSVLAKHQPTVGDPYVMLRKVIALPNRRPIDETIVLPVAALRAFLADVVEHDNMP